jgi:uncharacterized protein DUF4249
MKRIYIKWILIITVVLFYSCTKVIPVNLNDAAPQIVIVGNVTDSAGPYTVQLSKTVNFSDPNIFPAVSGALVSITDGTTTLTDTLTETTPGTYITHTMQGVPGHTYNLYVSAAGKTYTASSTMPVPVPLDSVTFIHQTNFGKTSIFAVVNFQDPANVANYYNFIPYINGVQFTKTLYAYDDGFVNGKYNSQELFMDSTYIKIGDTIAIEMDCIDKPVYNYFNTLKNATNGNNFQSTSPANPTSNISNNALGYFSAEAISKKEGVAK